jgi:hypothetical protein
MRPDPALYGFLLALLPWLLPLVAWWWFRSG